MKVKLTLVLLQFNKHVNYLSENYLKVYFDDDYNLPSQLVSTKDEKETLKELCLKHFEIDFGWLEKNIYDFRIVNNNGDITAEAVYIIHVPEIVGAIKNGSLLSFSKINEKQIKLDPFYERAITGAGNPAFR
jgi:hypothetical protein